MERINKELLKTTKDTLLDAKKLFYDGIMKLTEAYVLIDKLEEEIKTKEFINTSLEKYGGK